MKYVSFLPWWLTLFSNVGSGMVSVVWNHVFFSLVSSLQFAMWWAMWWAEFWKGRREGGGWGGGYQIKIRESNLFLLGLLWSNIYKSAKINSTSFRNSKLSLFCYSLLFQCKIQLFLQLVFLSYASQPLISAFFFTFLFF